MSGSIEINGRRIGPGYPIYVVAEMSANHNQDLSQAIKILEAAKEAGADAIKLQTYTPDTLTINCDKEHFRIGKGTIWEGKNLYDLYSEAYTPWDWQPQLKELADDLAIDLFSTPFDETAVEFLEKLEIPAFKIASFEIVDLALIKRVAETGKPVIMSTGMASLTEIEEAVQTFRESGGSEIILLKCTSAYPADPKEMNLRTIPHLADTFDTVTGISDHTLGNAVSIAAVVLGACVVEKHFTLSRKLKGPDSKFSLEPDEFKKMVDDIRTVEASLGNIHYGAMPSEESSKVFRRSLFVTKDVKKGELFTKENIRSIRPGYGLHTRYLDEIVGGRAKNNIEVGTPLSWNLIEL